MKIPIDKIEIAEEKITNYLLVKKKKNDKSAFLNQLGYTLENSNELVNDIKTIAANNEAHLQQATAFGNMYAVKGSLKNFAVVTIWLLAIDASNFKFITLFPE